MTTRRTLRVALVVVLVATFGHAISGQSPAPAKLRIVTLGGFLGWVDGLVLPADLDQAYGGLFGVQKWLDDQNALPPDQTNYQRDRDLLIFTGNNRPARLGTTTDADRRFAALRPDAVAVSVDDFLRALRPAGRAGVFAGELANHNQPPYVVSNAFVRLRKKGLHSVAQPGLTLNITPDESVGWVKTLTATCTAGPCPGQDADDKETVSATVEDTRNRNPHPIKVKATTDGKTLTLAFKPHLRPGAEYELKVTAPAQEWTFKFKTHHALTSARGSGGGTLPSELDGLPVQHVSREVGANRASIAVLGFVDPDVKSQLGADRWKWTVENSLPSLCDADECEIDFMPAPDAFDAIDSSLAAGGTRGHTFYVAISGLSDKQAAGLITDARKIDLMVMDPDTFLMGQDLGDTAIVTRRPRREAATTQVWTRPHWVGARANVLSAELAWNQPRWTLHDLKVELEDIKGEKVHWESNAGTIRYSLEGARGVTLGDGPYQVYAPASAQATKEPPAAGLWVSQQGTAALLLDVMRRRAKADLAMLPGTAIDPDVVKWLNAEAKVRPLNFMSRFMLEKAIYQMDDIAVTEVEGSKLAATLKALVKAEEDGGDHAFISGIGAATAGPTIDEKTLRINDREIVETHLYRIALPKNVAEAQGLEPRGDGLDSVVDAADLRLRGATETMLSAPDIATQLESAFAAKPRSYFNLTSAKVSLSRTEVRDSDGGFATIPTAGRAVKAQDLFSLSGFMDLGADFRTVALRATSDMNYSRQEQGDVVSYPNNEWTFGGRIDRRIRGSAVSRVFAGVFLQTWVRTQVAAAMTPSAPFKDANGVDVPNVKISGKAVTPMIERPKYQFVRVGAERDTVFKGEWGNLKSVLLAFDFGESGHEPTTITIGSMTFPLGDYYKKPQAFVDARFAAHPELFETAQTVTFGYSGWRPQNRLQIDGVFEITPPRPEELTLAFDLKIRNYLGGDDRPSHTADSSIELKATMAWPFMKRVTFGPFFEYYRVKAVQVDEAYRTVKYGVEMTVPVFIRLGWPGAGQ